MSYTRSSDTCPQCGAPIYVESPWMSTLPPPTRRSCACLADPLAHIQIYTSTNTITQIVPELENKQRFNYRTPDGIIHLWTQDEIDVYTQAMNTPIIDMSPYTEKSSLFEDDPVSIQEEAALTVKMLHDLLYRPYKAIDHETVQDLLSRIDVMREPLKELVQAMEVK